jgi:excinuclease ABC subunit B
MRFTIDETQRRRALQETFNRENGITPESVRKSITTILDTVYEADYAAPLMAAEDAADYVALEDLPRRLKDLRKEMKKAAGALEFERAAELRDQMLAMQKQAFDI